MPVTSKVAHHGDLANRVHGIADMLRAEGMNVEVSPDVARPREDFRTDLDAGSTSTVVPVRAKPCQDAQVRTPASRAHPFQGVRV